MWQSIIGYDYMKKSVKYIIFTFTFLVIFLISAILRIHLLGSAPIKLIKVDWNENVGIKYTDLDYKNENGNKYDLYIPKNLDKEKKQYLILFIHGGSFNSGSKEDGDIWCKYYASKGYITATVDYTLQNQGKEASIFLMNEEIESVIKAIKVKTSELGYNVVAMASSGVSAGGTLAMNLAYNSNSIIPVKFVFQLAAPTYFEPNDWYLLMKVNRWNSTEEFLKMMTGFDLNEKNYMEQVKKISPSALVNENTVPTLLGYGLRDHCVPLNQKNYLIDSLNKYEILYDYIEFPKSNHGMYNDLDKMQEFIDMSLEYCKRYFK
ncbi:S9 family peptidase [uncultured Clostridium sp.]|uniref:alpha/beta hydrolase family protein n=2 Tax=uncultured Clostridium sp. TaxID=59620 RepID=UPI0026ECBAC0|nr:prolyl oligopeptidase family serine peptidase [uncultured Clostridium sp.]